MSLRVQGPFDLQATVRLLQRRPSNRIDVWSEGRYRRALAVDGEVFTCAVANRGTLDAPRLELETDPPASRAVVDKLERSLRRMLGLGLPPGFELPGIRNRWLAALARALRGARPPRFPTLFESFGRVIPYQQVSLEAGGVLVSRFVERFGSRVDTEDGSVWAFPSAEVVAAAPARQFAGVGMSGAKARSIRRLAQMMSTGELTEEQLEGLSTPAALQRLDELPGIGPWTAAVILLRGLGRMDVFPVGDVGALKGLHRILGPKASVNRVVQNAGDRRGYLYFYALGRQLLERGLIGSPFETDEAQELAARRDGLAEGAEHA